MIVNEIKLRLNAVNNISLKEFADYPCFQEENISTIRYKNVQQYLPVVDVRNG